MMLLLPVGFTAREMAKMCNNSLTEYTQWLTSDAANGGVA